jgi:hypothetical protein
VYILSLQEKDESLLDDVLCSAVIPKGTVLVTQGEVVSVSLSIFIANINKMHERLFAAIFSF